LGVSEGAVRYHLRRAHEGAAADGRQKLLQIEQSGLAEAVAHWSQAQLEGEKTGHSELETIRERSQPLVFPGFQESETAFSDSFY
jgi:hypothetical protein